jgi:hypothetical protein
VGPKSYYILLDSLLLFLANPDHVKHRSGLIIGLYLHRQMVILLDNL